MNTAYGTYGIGRDPEQGAAMASDFDAKYGTDALSQYMPQGGGGGAAGVMGFIGQMVGAATDIIGGVTGVQQAKYNAKMTIEATRNQLVSGAISYNEAALNAKLAPVLQAQQLAVKQAQTRALLTGVLVLGGGGLILGLILSTRKPRKRRKGSK